mgnify:CR=1 FL=1
MDFSIGPYTDLLIKSCADEIKKKETRDKICDNIIYPILDEIVIKYNNKIHAIMSIIILLILLLILTSVIGIMNYQCIKLQND